MRILLVSQEFPPETGWGGIGTYVSLIAPALARAGAEPHVLSVVRDQPRSDRIVDGVRIHRAPLRRLRGPGRLARMPHTWDRVSLALAVAREHRRLGIRFDVCESPEWRAEGLGLALRRTPPVVVRLHSSAAQVLPYVGLLGRDRRLAIRCEEALVRRADVVTGTRSQLASAGSAIEAERAREITYPVARADLLPPPSGPPSVLFAGRFEARKGPEVLIRAVPELLRRVPDARVVLLGADTGVGEGGHAARLRAMVAELGVAGSVEIVERWGRDAVVEHLAEATVCVVPSRWESFGYVAAEAAALGRPVVASRIPALEDVVSDGVTGRLVPPDHPTALAEALADLLSDPAQAHQIGLRGARVIAQRCDPDRIAAETLDAYELAISHWSG